MDVSIIVINYNTLRLTQACIESVIKHTKDLEYEIILVDNASTDGSKELFKQDKRIKYIYSNENLGFGRANNLGYKYSIGKYIFLLNSDTILLNNAVYDFWRYAENADPSIACLGSPLLSTEGKIIHSFSSFPSIKSTIETIFNIYVRKKNEVSLLHHLPLLVDYVTGADLFIRKNVIEEHGFFSPDFFMYFEETELQFRYNQAGFLSMIIPGPKIIHLEGVSVGGDNKKKGRKRVMFFKGMYVFMKKRYGFLKYSIFRIIGLLYIPIVIRKDNTFEENKSLLNTILLGI